jgi:chromosome segregation ATPase
MGKVTEASLQTTDTCTEIATLKEQVKAYDKSRDAWMTTADERYGENVKLKEEIKKLTEEKEDLKETIQTMWSGIEAGKTSDEIHQILNPEMFESDSEDEDEVQGEMCDCENCSGQTGIKD